MAWWEWAVLVVGSFTLGLVVTLGLEKWKHWYINRPL